MILEDRNGSQAAIDATFQALRATLRPHDFRLHDGTHIGGDYSILATTGSTTGIGAAGSLFSARWTNADRLMVLQSIRMWAVLTTAYAAAQENSLDLVRVSNWGTADSGQTAIDVAESCRKDRRNMNAASAQMRISNAGAITNGAGSVEDSFAMRGVNVPLGNVAPAFASGVLYDFKAGHEHPMIFSNLEGFRIRNKIAQGAAGVISYTFEVCWLEAPAGLLAL